MARESQVGIGKTIRMISMTAAAILLVTGAAHGAPARKGAAPKAPAGPPAFVAMLTGATEVPGPGDPDGSGTATVTIDLAKGQLCYTLSVDKVEGVTMAHIHKAPVASMGNVVVPLSAPTAGSVQGCATPKPELLADIVANPTDYYVNVHSEAHIAGAVRGQLSPTTAEAAAVAAAAAAK